MKIFSLIIVLLYSAIEISNAQGLIAEYDFLVDANDRISENNFLGFVGLRIKIDNEDCRRFLKCEGNSYSTIINPDFGLTDEFTVTFWIRTPDGLPNQKIMGQVSLDDGDKKGWLIGIEDNHINVELFKNPDESALFESSMILNNDEWTHIIVAFKDNGNVTITQNGISTLEESASWTPPVDAQNAFVVGAAPWDPQFFFFTGDLDDIRIFNTEWTGGELKSLYERCPEAGRPIFVNKNATSGLNNGLSWTDGFIELQSAIDLSCSCNNDDVWITEGTYIPTNSFDLDNDDIVEIEETTFLINNPIKIYGGFTGDEVTLHQRLQNSFSPTILSAALKNGIDTAYHVMFMKADEICPDWVLDGLEFRDGRATSNSMSSGNSNKSGAGIHARATQGDNRVVIHNCKFFNNHSKKRGGAIYLKTASSNISTSVRNASNITNSLFYKNQAEKGGAIYFESFAGGGFEYSELCNNTFADNKATLSGGAIYIDPQGINESRMNIQINNGIFWNNDAPTGLDIFYLGNKDDNAEMNSTILSDNSSISTPAGQSFTFTDTLIKDPKFNDALNNDYRLVSGSPAINFGDSTYVDWIYDIEGKLRTVGEHVDIGAYEYGTNCPNQLSFYLPVTMNTIKDFFWTNKDIVTNATILNQSDISFSHLEGISFKEKFEIQGGSVMEVLLLGCD